MSDFFDHLPSHVREGIRKKMRSPEAYEKLREKVKGPEDLEREMEHNDKMAELRFAIESEPEKHDRLKAQVERDVREQGIDAVIDMQKIPDGIKATIAEGKFQLTVSAHPNTHEDALSIIPEGNVQERIPVKVSFAEKYVSQLSHST